MPEQSPPLVRIGCRLTGASCRWTCREKILQGRPAKIEDPFQARDDDQPVYQPGQLVVGQQIVHQVANLDTAIHLTEEMLMVPETIRSKTLLVNKEKWS